MSQSFRKKINSPKSKEPLFLEFPIFLPGLDGSPNFLLRSDDVAQKKRKKRTKQKQLNQRYLVIFSVMLFCFFIGKMVGQNENSLTDLTKDISEQIDSVFKSNTQKKTKIDAKITPEQTENLTFRFLDVGQGDATLIQSEDGTTILIDTGRYDDKNKRIIEYLNTYIGVGGKIDLLIFTHNDSDHIGHGDLVMDYFDVKEVWLNGHDSTTKVYEKLLDSIAAKDSLYEEPKSGEVRKIGPFSIEVLNPTEESKSNQNDDSIVTRISTSNFSSMFTGDAASRVEKEMLAKNIPLESTLLHVGHHGSKESNSPEWLAAVNPKIAIYSAGINNSYHHPSSETIERLKSLDIPFYGTDKSGTITISVAKDGTYSVKTEE